MKNRLPQWCSALLGLSLLCFTLRALEKLLSTYTKDYDQDPIKHNVYAYASADFIEVLHRIRGLFQPALDYALRRYLLFPIFGFDERAFRIPDALCFLLALWLVPLTIRAFLKRQGHPPAVALVAAIWSALWILENKLLLTYGVEGRHYTAAALVSMMWFSSVFLFEAKPRWVFYLLSLVFANTHLFSLPLLGAAFGIEAFHAYRERNWKDLRGIVVTGLAILVVTVGINYLAFTSLLQRPPAGTQHPLWFALRTGAGLWLYFLGLLALPLGWLLVPAGIVGALIPRKRAGFLLVFGVVFPLFLGYMRSKSDYPYFDRYYLPFFGLGTVIIAYGVDLLFRACRSFARFVKLPRPELLSLGVLCVALAGAFPGRDLLLTFTDLNRIKIPERYFTDGYKFYRRLRQLPGPKLVIYKPRQLGSHHIPDYYLVVDRSPEEPYVEVIPTGTSRVAKNERLVRAFWSEHADATVVFDWPVKRCVAKPSGIGTVIKSRSRCAVLVPGVKNLADFNALLSHFEVTLAGKRSDAAPGPRGKRLGS